jgi:hypothetical protein
MTSSIVTSTDLYIRFQCNEEIMICDEDLNIYLIPKSNPVVRLNLNATDIFRLCIAGNNLEEIVARYADIYECQKQETEGDVIAFINEMLANRYLLICS